MLKYFTIYDLSKFGQFDSVEQAQQAIKEHEMFTKSKYTRKGAPRSNYSELKRFAIVDNMGDLYYIY